MTALMAGFTASRATIYRALQTVPDESAEVEQAS